MCNILISVHLNPTFRATKTSEPFISDHPVSWEKESSDDSIEGKVQHSPGAMEKKEEDYNKDEPLILRP